MNSNPSVNRWLEDKAMDSIDHALGRPVWPLRETYRNHYAVDATSGQAVEFAFSPHWEALGQSGSMAFFAVSDAGRRALARHLAALPGQHRAFVISYEGFDRIVPARTREQARYLEYLSISDCFSELKFGDFLKQARVRVAA